MGPKSGSIKSSEKVLDNIKSMKDFDHMQRSKLMKMVDKQQSKEQKKKKKEKRKKRAQRRKL